MKADYSFRGLKKHKNVLKKIYYKKQLSIRIRIFIVNFPMRPELVFLIFFRQLWTSNWCILCVKGNFESKIYRKTVNSNKNYAKTEQKGTKYPVCRWNFKPR